MTDRHPLTDDIIDTLASPQYDDFGGDIGGVNTGFTYDDLRAAADWQLKQVIKALNQCKKEKRSCCEVLYLFHQKLEAMRPTTTQETHND